MEKALGESCATFFARLVNRLLQFQNDEASLSRKHMPYAICGDTLTIYYLPHCRYRKKKVLFLFGFKNDLFM